MHDCLGEFRPQRPVGLLLSRDFITVDRSIWALFEQLKLDERFEKTPYVLEIMRRTRDTTVRPAAVPPAAVPPAAVPPAAVPPAAVPPAAVPPAAVPPAAVPPAPVRPARTPPSHARRPPRAAAPTGRTS